MSIIFFKITPDFELHSSQTSKNFESTKNSITLKFKIKLLAIFLSATWKNQISEFFPVSDESYTNCVVVSEKQQLCNNRSKSKRFLATFVFWRKKFQIGNVQLPLKNDVTSLFWSIFHCFGVYTNKAKRNRANICYHFDS